MKTRTLELQVGALRRELACARNEFLDMGLKVSLLSNARDVALHNLQRTEQYLRTGMAGDTPREQDSGAAARDAVARGTRRRRTPGRPAGWRRAVERLASHALPALGLQGELARLRRELAGTLAAVQRLERYAAELERDNARVHTELARARAAANDSGTRPQVHKPAPGSIPVPPPDPVVETLKRVQQEKNDIGIALAERDDEIDTLQTRGTQLEQDIAQLAARASQLQRDLNQAQVANRNLHEKVDAEREASARRQRQLETLGAERDRLQSECGDLTARLGRLEEDLAETHADNLALQARVDAGHEARAQRDRQIEALGGERERLLGEREALNVQLAQLAKSLGDAQTGIQALRGEADAGRRAALRIERHFGQRSDERDRLASERETLAAEISRLEQALQAELGAERDEVAQLERALAEAGEKNASLREDVRAVVEEYAATRHHDREQIEALETRLAALEPQLAEAEQQVEALQLSLAEAAYRQEVSDTEIESLGERLDEVTAVPQRPPQRWTRAALGVAVAAGVVAGAIELRNLYWQPPAGESGDSRTAQSLPDEPLPGTDSATAVAALETAAGSDAGGASSVPAPPAPAAKKPPGKVAHKSAVLTRETGKPFMTDTVISLPGGVKYKVIRNGVGRSPQPGDGVVVSYHGVLPDGTEFSSAGPGGETEMFSLDLAIPGLQDVLPYMEEGAKWEVYLPTALAFPEPGPRGGQEVILIIELQAVIGREAQAGRGPEADIDRSTHAFLDEADAVWKAADEAMAASDEPRESDDRVVTRPVTRARIGGAAERFLAENARREGVVSLPSGLQYRVLKGGNGSGRLPRASDTVVLKYRGRLPDGREFDRSDEATPFTLDELIPGWQEALKQMEEGAQWELYIPPSLAHRGRTRKRGALGMRPLIYRVELVSIGQPDTTTAP